MAMQEQFHVAFKVSDDLLLEVSSYSTVKDSMPHLSLDVREYNRHDGVVYGPRYRDGGKLSGKPLEFWTKWNAKRFQALTDSERRKLEADLDEMKRMYEWDEKEADDGFFESERLEALMKSA